MITTSWYEFEYRMKPGEEWRPNVFRNRMAELGNETDPVDHDLAREMLVHWATRYRPDVRFRLVKITREVLDEEEIMNPDYL